MKEQTDSLYHLKLDIDKEYKDFAEDTIKSCIIFGTFVVLHIIFNKSNSLFTDQFALEVLSFWILGLAVYHLIYKVIITIY